MRNLLTLTMLLLFAAVSPAQSVQDNLELMIEQQSSIRDEIAAMHDTAWPGHRIDMSVSPGTVTHPGEDANLHQKADYALLMMVSATLEMEAIYDELFSVPDEVPDPVVEPDPEPVLVVDPQTPSDWDDLPFDVPAIPAYTVPTLEDCEWIIQDGVFTSQRGLPSETTVHAAYRASIAAEQELPITFGVWDNGGRAVAGGLWGKTNDHSITLEDGGDLSVEFLGLDDECEIMLSWSIKWGFPKYVGAYNIGLRGPDDTFVIRAQEGAGKVILDGCWWLPAVDYEERGKNHASALGINKWETLIIRNFVWRGEKPGTPGIDLREHFAYLNSCVDPNGGTWIVGNDLRGGNRTGFQQRPDPSKAPRPQGVIVVADNYAIDHGWNWEQNDGGQVISLWANPDFPAYVINNRIENAKYGCLGVIGQAPYRNWDAPDGFTNKEVFVYGNIFNNPQSKRAAVMISACETVHLYANDVQGNVILNEEWGMKNHGIRNGSVMIHDESVLDWDFKTYDAGKTRAMTQDELLLLVQ